VEKVDIAKTRVHDAETHIWGEPKPNRHIFKENSHAPKKTPKRRKTHSPPFVHRSKTWQAAIMGHMQTDAWPPPYI
jgi:hypothetical protein